MNLKINKKSPKINENYNMYLSPAGWYTFEYPEDWEVTEDDDCTTLNKKINGVGAIQFSAYETAEPQRATANLREYLDDDGIKTEVETVIKEGQEIARSVYDVEEDHTLLVFITKEKHLLFITYIVDLENKEIEEEEVETIIGSVRILV